MEKQLKKIRLTKKREKGITLIALVVTIIILLILAGISISMLTGQNGILRRTSEASEKTKKEIARELIQLEVMGVLNNTGEVNVETLKTNLDTNLNADTSKIEEIFIVGATTGKIILNGYEFYVDENKKVMDYNGTDIPKRSETQTELDRSRGTIDVVFLQNTGYNISEVPNVPLLDNTMVPVKFDKETNNWIVCDKTDPQWYKYEKQTEKEDGKTSEWANVMLTDDIVVQKGEEIYDANAIKTLLQNNQLETIVGATVTEEGSMLVWIPRYAYRITYYDRDNNIIGYSDSRGIVTKDGETPSSYNEPTTSINVKGTLENKIYEYFRPHPAFETDLDQGGWSTKLTGIWVGKFEATGTTSSITTKSSTKALRTKTIGTLWQSIKDNFKAKTTESHMMKNSEWGAIAYLTESNYGRNGTQVVQNTSEYYTGGGETAGAYKINTDQSTTGNVYGIYDISGGVREYVSSYIANNRKSEAYQFASTAGTPGSNNDKTDSTPYATVYKYDISSDTEKNNYNLSLNKIFGDATTEQFRWHSVFSSFVYSDYFFFARGGAKGTTENSCGAFSYGGTHFYTDSASSSGTRVVCGVPMGM